MSKKKAQFVSFTSDPKQRELERLINSVNNTRSAGEMLALREMILRILIDLSGIEPQDNQSVTDGE